MIKRPRIQTNEGPPDKYVQIISEVVDRPDSTYPVVIKPYKLDLSQFSDKVVDKMQFEIENVSDMDLDLTMISYAHHLFEVDLPKTIKALSTATAEIRLLKDATAEEFEKSFTFEVNDEKSNRFTVPVRRKIRLATDVHSRTESAGEDAEKH